jgi:hypothetical protein
MKNAIALIVTLLALGAGSAGAGGFATAGVTPPDEIAAGEVWNAELTIRQHGRTPLEGVEPTLTIRQGTTAKTFRAEPTDEIGVYVARVEFPSGGQWRYEVNDGFGPPGLNTHTFSPISVLAPSGGDGDGGIGIGMWWLVLALGGAGALLLAGIFGRRLTGRPARAAA